MSTASATGVLRRLGTELALPDLVDTATRLSLVQAQVFSPHHEGPSPYTFILTDTHGNTLWLSGLAAGYHGEGPRSAIQTLVECGFPNRDAQQVFTRSPVRLRRELEPPSLQRQIDPRTAKRETPSLCRSHAGYDVRDR